MQLMLEVVFTCIRCVLSGGFVLLVVLYWFAWCVICLGYWMVTIGGGC